MELLEDRRLMAVITVTTAADGAPAADAQVTLREAIEAMNQGTNLHGIVADTTNGGYGVNDRIIFRINAPDDVAQIDLTSALPAITCGELHIDGADAFRADDGSTRIFIVLNGGSTEGANGLVLRSSDNTITGLVIQNFDANGIFIDGPGSGFSGADGNLIEGCFIGTDVTGATRVGNGGNGVYVLGSSDNTVGGTTAPALDAGAGNLISGNGGNGVLIERADFSCTPINADFNLVSGNFIGVDVDGTAAALGNGGNGVKIVDGAGNNVGRTADGNGAGNIIGGNGGNGVYIEGTPPGSGVAGNLVAGNWIGTNASGAADLGNGGNGVAIFNGAGNTVGFTPDGKGAANVISANAGNGVEIEGNAKGSGLTANLVSGNWIGTNEVGAILGNGADGVHVVESDGNTVGGASDSLANTIRWNFRGGVWLQASSANTVENNTISNNGSTVVSQTYSVKLPTLDAAFVGFTGGSGAEYSLTAGQYFQNFMVNGSLNTISLSENSLTGDGYYVASPNEFDLTYLYYTDLANSVFRPYTDSLTSFSFSFDALIDSYYADGVGFTFAIAGAGDALGPGGLGYLGYTATNSIAIGLQTSGVLGLYVNGEFVEGTEIDLGSNFGYSNSHFDISYANGKLTVQVAVTDYYDYGSNGYGVLISNGLGEGSGSADENVVAANAITDNYGDGVRIENDAYYGDSSGPTKNLVSGNVIQRNDNDGVEIYDAPQNYVRDNSINDNGASGVLIEDYDGNAVGNEVTGNTITGNDEGVTVYADENFIGLPGAGNDISGNAGIGVYIDGDKNVVQANTVSSNGTDGVVLSVDAGGNSIGGSNSIGAGNTITGNGDNGVVIGTDARFTCGPERSFVQGNFLQGGNFIQGNSIASNGLNGVFIRSGQSYNLIGQFTDLDPDGYFRNTIANNGQAGVAVGGGQIEYVYYDEGLGEWVAIVQYSSKNAIVGNYIYGNGTLPIDLLEPEVIIGEGSYVTDGATGPTANDDADPDDGPNELQNYPTLDPAVVSGSIVSYTTHFDSPGKEGDFYFEFFGYTSSGGVVFLGGFYTLPETFTLDQSIYPNVTQIGVTATRLAFYRGGEQRITPFAETPFGLQVGSTSEMFLIAVPQPDDDPPDVNVINTLEEEPASERTVTDSSVIVPPQDAATLASVNSLSLRRAQELQELNRFFSQEPLADSPGEIHGRLFDDVNAVGQKADGTLPLSGYQVYIDLNGNGELDEGEPITATNENGEYSFTGLRPGQYIVKPVLGRNDDQTFGTREDNRVELRSGVMVINNVDFGVRIRGRRAAPRRSGMLPGMEHHGLLASPDELARYWSDRAVDEAAPLAETPALTPPVELAVEAVAAPTEAPGWWTWLTLGAGVVIGPWFHIFRKRKRRSEEVS